MSANSTSTDGARNKTLTRLALVHVLTGFDATRGALQQVGCSIDTFAGDGLCIPSPTCMTRPLLRA